MHALELLLTRNSMPRLVAPAPDDSTMQHLYQAGLRAPDHGCLRPWRFIEFQGQALQQLGEYFVQAQQQEQAQTTPAQLEKTRQMCTRAPMLVLVVAVCQSHPKVPEVEQLMSAACAAHGILLAAHALGWGAMWRTGWLTYSPSLHQSLSLQAHEKLVGFLYLGTPAGAYKPLPGHQITDFVTKISG
ncbi:Nitroreductase [Allopseudospirillum japonicum]|uniref:Putative NAD(P)H nitroreductase n=1 Tax=Allopseudospirillum japonicum TaxID=64971 RepID=A0A1H6T774_9GAMM|nr:nitroreductase family protein [Allopseudospirillum japonicum]SEI72140.1 Nitroreductase [Allopseudospirillum japonicum]